MVIYIFILYYKWARYVGAIWVGELFWKGPQSKKQILGWDGMFWGVEFDLVIQKSKKLKIKWCETTFTGLGGFGGGYKGGVPKAEWLNWDFLILVGYCDGNFIDKRVCCAFW